VSQMEKDGFWVLVYEITENGRVERVEIEIPKEK